MCVDGQRAGGIDDEVKRSTLSQRRRGRGNAVLVFQIKTRVRLP